MNQPLRWGVLGTGNIARKFAAQLSQTPRAELVAVGSRSARSADGFAEEFGGTAHGSYEALLADPAVEAIYNSTPNTLHHPWTIRAMEAGKHVLCEKPFAANVAEAEEMFAVADRVGRVAVEAFMYRAHPAIIKLIETVRGGAIGDLKLIRTHFTYNRAQDPEDVRYQAELAGGSLMDVGCYCVNLARAVAGAEPSGLHAVIHRHEHGVDDYAAGTLTFGEGEVLCVFTSGMTVEADRTTYLCGTEGYILIDSPWFTDGRFTLVKGEERRVIEAPASMGLYALEAEAFADVVGGGAEPWITRADTLGNMRTLDGLRTSAGLGY